MNSQSFTGFRSAEAFEAAGVAFTVFVDVVKYFIILFPCMDLFSAFSLNAIVLVGASLRCGVSSIVFASTTPSFVVLRACAR
jgi:hypothetical protein